MRTKFQLSLTVLAFVGAAFGADTPIVNPDFEMGQPGEIPSGWTVPQALADEGFSAVLTTDSPIEGKQCVEIRWPKGATAPSTGFANLLQRVDAATLRGKRIKVTAAIRIASDKPSGRAQMWLRVDRPTGAGAFDNMSDRPIVSGTWAEYSITADIEPDAETLNLGLMTFEGATAWWDNVRSEVVIDPIALIRDEGMNRSQVMATLSYLSDVVGPRLTGSPALRRASEWTRDRLTAWGMENAHLEPWGPFGRGWSLHRFSAQIIEPQAIPLVAYPKAWSPSVGPQPLEADVVHVDIKKSEDFERHRGNLRGKIVLDGPVQDVKVNFEPLAARRNEADLLALANSDGTIRRATTTTPSTLITPEQRAATALFPRRYQFYAEEGVAVILAPSWSRAGALSSAAATVYPPREAATEKSGAEKSTDAGKAQEGKATSVAPPLRSVVPWSKEAPPIVPQVTVLAEHYNRLVRMSAQGERLRASIELQAEYHTADPMSANVIAEIPGTDLAGELVMLGAHLDSWQSGTGATDNAAGCAVVLEAMRILRALDLKPRRTIRVALWTGEEQNLQGSRAYVTAHFGAPQTSTTAGASPAAGDETMKKKPPEELSVYFNLDTGGGKIRGIFLQNHEAARPIFRQWLKPFRDLGAETISLANHGGSDHLSFVNLGLPGFAFMQDEMDYWTRTHHSSMDVYERVIADDVKQASVIMAAFVYEAAMRDEKFPRKPRVPAPATPAPAEGR